MLKKLILATSIALGIAVVAPTFAAAVSVEITPDQWHDWRWREDHRSEWRSWHKNHHKEWIEWRTTDRNDWDRWCYYHHDECRD